MRRNVVVARPEMPILEAARLMGNQDVGSIVICEDDKPVGIVTERDFLRKVIAGSQDPKTTRLKDIMSAPVVCVNPSVSIREAARLILENSIRRLPVVEEGKLVGIITARDITGSILGTMARQSVAVPAS